MKSFTQVEAAREVGTTKQQINRYVKSGRISLNPEGKIDKNELGRFKSDYLDKSNGSNGNGNGKDKKRSLWEEQARLAGHKADIAEMESLKMSGQLVEIDVVVAELSKLFYAIRQCFLGMGARLAPQLAKKTPAFIKREIDIYVDESLNELRKYDAGSGKIGTPKPARTNRKARAKNEAKRQADRKPVGK